MIEPSQHTMPSVPAAKAAFRFAMETKPNITVTGYSSTVKRIPYDLISTVISLAVCSAAFVSELYRSTRLMEAVVSNTVTVINGRNAETKKTMVPMIAAIFQYSNLLTHLGTSFIV